MRGSKADYFAQSQEGGLPPRCPILERCARRLSTLKIANGSSYRGKECHDSDLIPEIGEPASQIGGTSNFIFSNICPEVPLFDTAYFYSEFTGIALTKAQYDNYMDPPVEYLETGHFSECAEFALFNMQNYRGMNLKNSGNVTNNTINVTGQNSRVNYESVDNSVNSFGDTSDLRVLEAEFARLREALLLQAKSPDHFAAIGRIAEAEKAASVGDQSKVGPALAAVGSGAKWVLSTARSIGVSLAVKVLEQHMGL